MNHSNANACNDPTGAATGATGAWPGKVLYTICVVCEPSGLVVTKYVGCAVGWCPAGSAGTAAGAEDMHIVIAHFGTLTC